MHFIKPLSILGATSALLLSSGGLLQRPTTLDDTASSVRLGGGYVPVEITIQEGVVGPGQMVTYRVVLDGVTDRDQKVSISCSVLGVFSLLPTVVTVPAGSNSVQFSAVLGNQLPLLWLMSATCNGGTVTMAQIVPIGEKH